MKEGPTTIETEEIVEAEIKERLKKATALANIVPTDDMRIITLYTLFDRVEVLESTVGELAGQMSNILLMARGGPSPPEGGKGGGKVSTSKRAKKRKLKRTKGQRRMSTRRQSRRRTRSRN